MAEDTKFKFEDGKFINRVSGEAIPDDEPVMIFRARDKYAARAIHFYMTLCEDDKHVEALREKFNEFLDFSNANSDRMKEPGITGDFKLKDA